MYWSEDWNWRICLIPTSSDVWRQPELMHSATERHSSSVLGLRAVIWEKMFWPRSWDSKRVRLGWRCLRWTCRLCVKHRGGGGCHRDAARSLSASATSHAERVRRQDREDPRVLHTLPTWGQFARNTAWKCPNIISSSCVSWTIARSEVRIEYLIGNCYRAARRRRQTEEGRQRVVNTEERNYWHRQPTSLPSGKDVAGKDSPLCRCNTSGWETPSICQLGTSTLSFCSIRLPHIGSPRNAQKTNRSAL